MPDAVNTTVNGKYKKLGGVIYRGVPTALEYMKIIMFEVFHVILLCFRIYYYQNWFFFQSEKLGARSDNI